MQPAPNRPHRKPPSTTASHDGGPKERRFGEGDSVKPLAQKNNISVMAGSPGRRTCSGGRGSRPPINSEDEARTQKSSCERANALRGYGWPVRPPLRSGPTGHDEQWVICTSWRAGESTLRRDMELVVGNNNRSIERLRRCIRKRLGLVGPKPSDEALVRKCRVHRQPLDVVAVELIRRALQRLTVERDFAAAPGQRSVDLG